MSSYLVSYFQFKKFLLIFWILTANCFGVKLFSDFEPGGKPEIKFINPDAEAVIGAVINIRERGSGLFGCGERRIDGVITADALKWMVDDLNKKIWSGTSSNVSLGLYIMDSCSRTRTAATQLVEFLPELLTNEKPQQGQVPFKFCLIDDINLETEADISKSLKDINFSVVSTNVNLNSPQVLVNAILLFIQELRWEHLIVVHSNSKFSSMMLKQFTKLIKKFDLCIPWVINIEEDGEELQNILNPEIPILSLLPVEENPYLLKVLQEKKKINVLFSDYVSRDQLKIISNDIQIFAVIPFPEKDVGFENYFTKNSIMQGIRTEDELDLAHRTRIVRKIKQIGSKLSEALRNAVCDEKERLCQEGRSSISQYLAKTDWMDVGLLYELVKYQYQFPKEHVYFHKIMAYNGHKNLEVFETTFAFPDLNCEGENSTKVECRCLEVKSVRSVSGRNIEDWGGKKRQTKYSTDKGKNLSQPDIVHQYLPKPMVFAFFSNPLHGTLACLALLGCLLTLIIAQYFATSAALPNGSPMAGTSIIGYMILIGLFLLFSTNISFLLSPLTSTCALRRFCPAFSYSVIFSGMLIKVWSSFVESRSNKNKNWKPITLFMYLGALSMFQVIPSGLWLLLKPPTTEYISNKWQCYPSGDLDSHLIISMLYPILLLLTVLILATKTCSKCKNDEARWILISSSLIAILFGCWGVAIATEVWQVHRTACTNLASGTILLLCLYVPKIKTHSDLKKSLKAQPIAPPVIEDFNKERSIFATNVPVVFGYNSVATIMQESVLDPNYVNQAYSVDENSETVSSPFDLDSSCYSETDQEPYTFSTFLEDPQVSNLEENPLDDPTQVIPSALYPIEMFNNEPVAIASDHCQPGTNEFTPPHRTTSQLYLCPQPDWVP